MKLSDEEKNKFVKILQFFLNNDKPFYRYPLTCRIIIGYDENDKIVGVYNSDDNQIVINGKSFIKADKKNDFRDIEYFYYMKLDILHNEK